MPLKLMLPRAGHALMGVVVWGRVWDTCLDAPEVSAGCISSSCSTMSDLVICYNRCCPVKKYKEEENTDGEHIQFNINLVVQFLMKCKSTETVFQYSLKWPSIWYLFSLVFNLYKLYWFIAMTIFNMIQYKNECVWVGRAGLRKCGALCTHDLGG